MRVKLQQGQSQNLFKGDSTGLDDEIVYSGWTESKPQRSYLAIETRHSKQATLYYFEGKEANYRVPSRPKISPDGQYVSFFYGLIGDSHDYPPLYVLNLKDNRVREIQSFVKRGDIKWSPDSLYLAVLDQWYSEDAKPEEKAPTLYLDDIRTGKSRKVACDKAIEHSFEWGSPHKLYYSDFPAKRDKISDAKAAYIHPDLYSFEPATSKKQLVARDAYRPCLSLNGKWIAFFGSEHPNKPYPMRGNWGQEAYGVALTVVKSDGTGRKALNVEKGVYPALGWAPDDTAVFAIDEVDVLASEPKVERGAAVFQYVNASSAGTLKRWNIQTGSWLKIAELNASHAILDQGDLDQAILSLRIPDVFTILKTTTDSHVIVQVLESIKSDYPLMRYRESIVRVGGSGGIPIVQAEKILRDNFDWHDASLQKEMR